MQRASGEKKRLDGGKKQEMAIADGRLDNDEREEPLHTFIFLASAAYGDPIWYGFKKPDEEGSSPVQLRRRPTRLFFAPPMHEKGSPIEEKVFRIIATIIYSLFMPVR